MKTIEQIICDESIDPRFRVMLLHSYEEEINSTTNFNYLCWSLGNYPRQYAIDQRTRALKIVNEQMKDYKYQKNNCDL